MASEMTLLRQPFRIVCDSPAEARNLHAAFQDITKLTGNEVAFSRSIRIREAKTLAQLARRPRK